MKVIALLNFYDENPNWLAACVAGAAQFCDHVVCLDGGYFLFPQARPHSGIESHEAIQDTAYTCGIGCTISAPSTIYYGNEVEKRNQLVQMGMAIAETGKDWFFRVDADEWVTDVPGDLRERLETTEANVGGVTLWWRTSLGPDAPENVVREFDTAGHQDWMRFLIRAVPDLRVEGAHNFYLGTVNGRENAVLYGRRDMHDEEPVEDFNDLKLEHRHVYRNTNRNQRAEEFNLRRDQLGVERVWDVRVETVEGERVQIP